MNRIGLEAWNGLAALTEIRDLPRGQRDVRAWPLLAKLLGGKRQLRLVAQRQLAQRFADRQKAVIGPLAAVSGPTRDVANLGPFLIGLLRLIIHPTDQRLPGVLRRRQHGGAKSLGHVRADRERDDAKARVFPLAAIQ